MSKDRTGKPAGHRIRDRHDALLGFLSRMNIPPRDTKELAALTEYVEYDAGKVLLTEGQPNTTLYFLVQGAVQILRSGEIIATLTTPGDALGEISLITGKPCAASSVLARRSSLLAIDIARVDQLSEEARTQFTNSLNRFFSLILAEKLSATNEKARLFEITNRELRRAQKAMEAASEDKIGELTLNQHRILRKLNVLLQGELPHLQAELHRLAASPSHASPDSLGALTQSVHRLISELEPVKSSLEVGAVLKDKNVLIAEDDLQEQINAKMSLGSAGVELTVVSSMEEGKEALTRKKFDVVCVNQSFVELIPFSKNLHQGCKYVFMTSQQIAEHFKTLQSHQDLSTIIARHPEDRLFTVKNTATTIQKLVSGDIFGASKYLSWGTELRERRITHSGQREALIQEMDAYFEGMGVNRPLRRKCERVAEELLMNAIYDAPTDENGKALYNHLSRTVPVTLAPTEQGLFRYGCDGAFLAVSVEDPFGALRRSTILNYLERCFGTWDPEAPENKLEGKGGGGNGLFQLIQSASLVVFNVRPKIKTEVIALLNINVQMNKVNLFPSFHFFESA